MKTQDIAEKFAYRVVWSQEDQEYVGSAPRCRA